MARQRISTSPFVWISGLLLFAGFCAVLWSILLFDYKWGRLDQYWGNLGQGWLVTVAVYLAALVLSIVFGGLLTAFQLSPLAPVRWLARAIVEIIRGTPLLVQILIGFYVVADQMQIENRFIVGATILSFFSAAYLSEIFRGGIESIPTSQWTSAKAIGLTSNQTYRLVVLPQAIRRVLPSTAGELANLIKNSSLLFVISLPEFTMAAREVNAITYTTFEAYLPLAAGYLVLTLPISIFARWLEKKYRFES